jgi:hypothetical protein
MFSFKDLFNMHFFQQIMSEVEEIQDGDQSIVFRISRKRLEEIILEELEEIYPGNEELQKLGRGITAEMNQHHSPSTGEFTSKSKSGCDSLYFYNGERASKGPKDDSGRGRHKHRGTGKYKCSTGQKKSVQEGEEEQQDAYIKSVVASELRKAFAKFQQKQQRNRNCSTAELLAFMDKYKKAEDGKLTPEPGKKK